MKQETAVLDPVTNDTAIRPDERAAYRTGLRNSPAEAHGSENAAAKRSFGQSVKGVLARVGKVLERYFEHDHEFDYRS